MIFYKCRNNPACGKKNWSNEWSLGQFFLLVAVGAVLVVTIGQA